MRRKRKTREQRLAATLAWIQDKLEKERSCREHTLNACIDAARRALSPKGPCAPR